MSTSRKPRSSKPDGALRAASVSSRPFLRRGKRPFCWALVTADAYGSGCAAPFGRWRALGAHTRRMSSWQTISTADLRRRPVRHRRRLRRRAGGPHRGRPRRPGAARRGVPGRRHLRDPRLRAEEADGLCRPLRRRVRGCRRLRLDRARAALRLERPEGPARRRGGPARRHLRHQSRPRRRRPSIPSGR